ncbi:MAG TPA: helix-turn-helix domain-containing protein [Anaerolineales bacterium]|nr:helix-turn-helix domain-containing protein [Anaerolineales bacterium]
MRCSDEQDHTGINKTLEIVGDKWTVPLIHHLVQGKNRFGILKRSMPGISPKTLTLRLRKLEADGIIARKVFPEVPLHVEYRLTEKGRSLEKVFQAMHEWGK